MGNELRSRLRRRTAGSAVVLCALCLVLAFGSAAVPVAGLTGDRVDRGLTADIAGPAPAVAVEAGRGFQRIDGFGFAEAFGRSAIMHGSQGLSPANQQLVLDLLFDPVKGAGLSILRNGIGSSPTSAFGNTRAIEPISPGSPDATPTVVWDGSDNSQVWLSQQAARRGVRTIYADAWSAPGYMKTNGDDTHGGMLCGMPGVAACATGDWRQAYANMLAKYIELYRDSGVRITHVGFLNEPELSPTYSSMLANGAQAADFIEILAHTLRAQHLDTRIVCCDAVGWQQGADKINAIMQDPRAASDLAVASSHGYAAPPASPLTPARIPVWQSEWADFNPWNPVWDDGSPAAGFTWANRILVALTAGDVSAFLHWWGASASTANSGLVRLQGDSVELSARFWAFAAFSKFIRPGAVRVASLGNVTSLGTGAFRNQDGSVVVELLNSGTAATDISLTLRGVDGARSAGVLLTGTGSNLVAQAPLRVDNGRVRVSVPARSLLTLVVPHRR